MAKNWCISPTSPLVKQVSEKYGLSKRDAMTIINTATRNNPALQGNDVTFEYLESQKEYRDALLMFADRSAGENAQQEYEREIQNIKRNAIADGTFMKAPNGKPTNLTEKQWLQVRTKAFKNWFGDWENDPKNASKVVDENGEPLVVYHGTLMEFDKFDMERLGQTTGRGYYIDKITGEKIPYDSSRAFFFADNPDVAYSYRNLYIGEELKLKRIFYENIIYSIEDNHIEFHKLEGDAKKKQADFIDNILSPILGYDVRNALNKKLLNDQEKQKLVDYCEAALRKLKTYSDAQSVSNQRRYITDNTKNLDYLKKHREDILNKKPLSYFLKQNMSFSGYDKNGKQIVTVHVSSEGGREELQAVFNDDKGLQPITKDNIDKLFSLIEESLKLNKDRLYEDEKEGGYDKGNILSAFLNIRNPLSHNYEGSAFPDKYKPNKKYPTAYVAARQVNRAIKDGKDGVIYENIQDPFEMTSYGVFNPNQIKSATDNVGSFRTNDPLIDYLSDEPATVIKGQLGVDKAQLISLLGSTMYKANVQEVAVKELIQNAFDAVKIAKSQGEISDAKIDIRLDDTERTVTVSDNGTGMTPEIVQKAFFTIGGSYKGEGVDNRLKSGGLGLAKMAFLFSSEYVEVTTIKDGIKTYVRATPEEIQNDNFNFVTSKTDEPNGTSVKVKIPEKYIDENDKEQTIYFSKSPSFLDRHMIGDVTLNVIKVYDTWAGKKEETKSYYKGNIPAGYQNIGKAHTDFGDIEIYLAPADAYNISSSVLISGLYQFAHYVRDYNEDKYHFKCILNILPKVGIKDRIYPINNQRENFRDTIQPEISDLKYLLLKINSLLGRKSIASAFGNSVSMDTRELNKEQRIPDKNEILKDAVDEVIKEFKPFLPSANTQENTIDFRSVRSARERSEKERSSSFDASDIKLETEQSAIDTSNLDINKPIFHNNTTMVIGEDGQKVLKEIGAMMLELKDLFIQTYKDSELKYRSTSTPLVDFLNSQFWGISFDENYGGVNVSPKILSMLAINPFYKWRTYKGVDPAKTISAYIVHLIKHEFNHNFQTGEGAGFTGILPQTDAMFEGIGELFDKWKQKLYNLVKENLETFKKYQEEYEKSRNKGESFEGSNIFVEEDSSAVDRQEPSSRRHEGGDSGSEVNGNVVPENGSGDDVSSYGGVIGAALKAAQESEEDLKADAEETPIFSLGEAYLNYYIEQDPNAHVYYDELVSRIGDKKTVDAYLDSLIAERMDPSLAGGVYPYSGTSEKEQEDAIAKVNSILKKEEEEQEQEFLRQTYGYTKEDIMDIRSNLSEIIEAKKLSKLSADSIFKLYNAFKDQNRMEFIGNWITRYMHSIVTRIISDQQFRNRFNVEDNATRQDIYANDEILSYIKDTISKEIKAVAADLREDGEEDLAKELDYSADNLNTLFFLYGGRIFKAEGISVDINGNFLKTDSSERSNERNSVDEGEDTGEDVGEKPMNDFSDSDQNKSVMSKIVEDVKSLLYDIYEVDSSGDPTVDRYYGGFVNYISVSKAVNTLLDICDGCDSFSEMVEALKYHVKSTPWISQLLEILNADSDKSSVGTSTKSKKEQLQTQFFQSLNKMRMRFITTYETTNELGEPVYRNSDANVRHTSSVIYNSARNKFSRFSGLPIFKQGVLDMDVIKEINMLMQSKGTGSVSSFMTRVNSAPEGQRLQELAKAENLIKSSLRKVGIDISDDQFENYLVFGKRDDSKNDEWSQVQHRKKRLNKLKNELITLTDDLQKLAPVEDPFIIQADKDQDKYYIRNDYERISDLIGQANPDSYEAMAYMNSKSYYPWNNPSSIQRIIRKITSLNEDKRKSYIREKYGSDLTWFAKPGSTALNPNFYSDILNELYNGGPTDQYGETIIEYAEKPMVFGKEYGKLNSRDYAISMLNDFMSSLDKNARYAWYRVLIASDKPRLGIFKSRRYKKSLVHPELDFRNYIPSKAVDFFAQELRRAIEVVNHAYSRWIYPEGEVAIENYDPEINEENEDIFRNINKGKRNTIDDVVKNGRYIFRNSGASFYFNKFIVKEIESKSELGKIIVDTVFNYHLNGGKDLVSADTVKTFRKQFLNYMTSLEDSFFNKLKRIGLLEERVDMPKTDEERRTIHLKHFSGSLKEWHKNESNFNMYANNKSQARELAEKDSVDLDSQPEYMTYYCELAQLKSDIQEFIYNNWLAKCNMLQLFDVDPAYYGNTVNFQKRNAQVVSAGETLDPDAQIHGHSVSDRKLRSITILTDKKLVSNVIYNIEKALRDVLETITDPKVHKKFEEGIENTVSELKKIDSTDGQAFTGLTGLRKKLVKFGKWSRSDYEALDEKGYIKKKDGGNKYIFTDEAVYRRMKRGYKTQEDKDAMVRDLMHVFTQPRKPFMYGFVNMERNGRTITVPIQHKNSEYTLPFLTAFAVMNEDLAKKPEDRRLSVLDAMAIVLEESADADATKGIDTINWDSCVKIGNTSKSIDLTSKTGWEALEILRTAIYGSNNEADRMPANYQNGTVTEYDEQDYKNVANKPEHIKDSSQPIGSQVKIISIANTSDEAVITLGNGKTVTGRELKSRYLKALDTRSERVERRLVKELGLNLPKEARIHKISNALKRYMASDQKFSVEMRKALSIREEDGVEQFVLPLDEIGQQSAVEAMIISKIRKLFYRQQFTGGMVVQATSWGASEDLNIRFYSSNPEDAKYGDGTPIVPTMKEYLRDNPGKTESDYKTYIDNYQQGYAWFEYEMTMPEDIARRLSKNGVIDKKYLNPDHTWNMEEIKKVIPIKELDAICYRIPTQAKYSVMACRLKRFAPESGGSVAKYPLDLTKFTDSDFDIDTDSIERRPTKGSEDYDINSVIFDLQMSSLKAAGSLQETFTIGDFSDLSEQSYMVKLLEEGYPLETLKNMSTKQLRKLCMEVEDMDLMDPVTDMVLREQNMEAKDMIAQAAVGVASHAFMTLYNDPKNPDNTTRIMFYTPNDEGTSPNETFWVVNDEDPANPVKMHIAEEVTIDSIYDADGNLISTETGKYVGASADAAKDAALYRLGISTDTLPVLEYMHRLGIPGKLARLFIAQPIIKQLMENVRNEDMKGAKSIYDAIDDLAESIDPEQWNEIAQDENLTLRYSELLENIANSSKKQNIVKQYTWSDKAANNYEVSSDGDKRFSALNATLSDGRTIEDAYQLDVKGYRQLGYTWRQAKADEGKNAPNKLSKRQLYAEYLKLWEQWASENPDLIEELRQKAKGKTLTDKFAGNNPDSISQARALADILNKTSKTTNASIDPIVFSDTYYTRNTAESDTETLHVFTDNSDRDSGSKLIPKNSWYAKKYGEGHHYPSMTSAVVRGLDNAYPITTQRWYHDGAKGVSGRWQDADFEEFSRIIKDDIEEIKKAWNSGKYRRIKFPGQDGLFNTSISNISEERTPRLYEFLRKEYDSLIDYIRQNPNPGNFDVEEIAKQKQSDYDKLKTLYIFQTLFSTSRSVRNLDGYTRYNSSSAMKGSSYIDRFVAKRRIAKLEKNLGKDHPRIKLPSNMERNTDAYSTDALARMFPYIARSIKGEDILLSQILLDNMDTYNKVFFSMVDMLLGDNDTDESEDAGAVKTLYHGYRNWLLFVGENRIADFTDINTFKKYTINFAKTYAEKLEKLEQDKDFYETVIKDNSFLNSIGFSRSNSNYAAFDFLSTDINGMDDAELEKYKKDWETLLDYPQTRQFVIDITIHFLARDAAFARDTPTHQMPLAIKEAIPNYKDVYRKASSTEMSEDQRERFMIMFQSQNSDNGKIVPQFWTSRTRDFTEEPVSYENDEEGNPIVDHYVIRWEDNANTVVSKWTRSEDVGTDKDTVQKFRMPVIKVNGRMYIVDTNEAIKVEEHDAGNVYSINADQAYYINSEGNEQNNTMGVPNQMAEYVGYDFFKTGSIFAKDSFLEDEAPLEEGTPGPENISSSDPVIEPEDAGQYGVPFGKAEDAVIIDEATDVPNIIADENYENTDNKKLNNKLDDIIEAHTIRTAGSENTDPNTEMKDNLDKQNPC